jgi:hypothetical protein
MTITFIPEGDQDEDTVSEYGIYEEPHNERLGGLYIYRSYEYTSIHLRVNPAGHPVNEHVETWDLNVLKIIVAGMLRGAE